MSKFFPFHYDTDRKLREIFQEGCNLCAEQYDAIRSRFIFLVCDIQDVEPQEEIEKKMDHMRVVFDFLLDTKEITLKQHCDLHEMLEDVWNKAVQTKAKLMAREGTVL